MANHPSVVDDGDLEWDEQAHGEKFGYRRKQLSRSAGDEKLGCSLYEVPPRRRAWPYHYHLANEEAIYVLEGSGTLRIGGEQVRISKGTYVALPARAQSAHQIVNDSEAVLRYLCFSTMEAPDVMVYPDSGKVGIFGGAAPGGQGEEDLQQVPLGRRRGRLLRRRRVAVPAQVRFPSRGNGIGECAY